MGRLLTLFEVGGLDLSVSVILSRMRKRQNKIQIIQPFANLTNNWELIHQIQSSLNKYLAQPHLYTNVQPGEEVERLGRQGIEQIVKFSKNLLQIIESLRAEQKNIEQIKLNAQLANEKLEQHEQIVRNYEKKFSERTKALVDQNRMLKESNDKMKKAFNQNEDNLKTIIEQGKGECNLLRQELAKEESENKRLLMLINELQEEIKNQKEIAYKLKSSIDGHDRSVSLKEKVARLQDIRIQSRRNQEAANAPKYNVSALERISLIEITSLSKILKFLTPKEILTLASLNKHLRFLILKSKDCVFEFGKSIKAVKNKQISYYHKHVEYFERLCNKIPEEILQMTYFKYHILKDTIGSEIMSILNSSAVIFEGKFLEGGDGEELYAGITQQAQKKIELKFNTTEATLLDVDPEIVQEYISERNQEKQKLMKLFDTMYSKISSTFQLYRADIESSTLFIDNVLKHFSKVFILSKNLYFQAQNLQNLNFYLLNELNKWDRMEIDKNLQLQDLRAQLQAEKKLKVFFTDKSIKSQQKALIEQNLKLTFQMKYTKMSDLMNMTCSEKDDLSRKNDQINKLNEKLNQENKQIRRLYENIREKYNKITEELAVVKDTIIKMNIL